MNKNRYRVIFSKTLQRLVVVSELSKTKGKATQSQASVGGSVWCSLFSSLSASLSPKTTVKLTALSLSLFYALGFVSFCESAWAETLIIRADSHAPKNQQPIVLQTANGIPQVNIQTPNEKGLSHNKYQDFNVDNKGAILNNSRTNVQTQQGGWVQGNPYLARGEAKVILNEVTSNHPSQLKGYIEVAGKKAEVIIANPNGLHCEGCGVINANRATFTTGKPQLKDGNLDAFVVEKGKVKITGKGLDASRVDYTEILARETEVNAGIWAGKRLDVVTGQNKVKNRTSDEDIQITYIKPEETSAASSHQTESPRYAVDVSELGGMYAGKIHLIGTEQGLGVRNAGHIGASSDSLSIDSQGHIVNQGKMVANQNIQIKTPSDFNNQKNAEITARDNSISIQSKSIEQSGSILAKQRIHLQTKQLNQSVDAQIGAGDVRIESEQALTNRGLINSQRENGIAKTVLKAEQIKNLGTGRIYGDDVALGAKYIVNQDEVVEGNMHSAVIAGRNRIDLGATEILNQNTQYYGSALEGTQIYSAGSLYIGKELDDTDRVIGQAIKIDNNSALIESEKEMHLSAQYIINHNDFFETNLQVTSDKTVDWHYIVPEGVPEEILRIDRRYLRNESGSRGKSWLKWISNLDKSKKPLKGDVRSSFLPEVTICETSQCHIDLANYYLPTDPAWSVFRIKTQQRGSSDNILNEVQLPVEPVAPIAPIQPQRNSGKRKAAYEQKLKQYSQDKAQYDKDYAQYEIDKSNFEREIKPIYLQWMKDNANQFEQLAAAINSQNQKLSNEAYKQYQNYWVKEITRETIKEDVVIKTQAAKILSGADLSLAATQVTNDKSHIIAGGNLTISAAIENLNYQGQQITQTYGNAHFSYLKKRRSKTASGRSKYKRVDDNWRNGLLSEVSHNITLPIAKQFAHYQYAADERKEQYIGEEIRLPSSSLYRINPDVESHVLVETDPNFTNKKRWLSSDYMFNALRVEPNYAQKRLGDGYYEQRLVREQINHLTGRAFLNNYRDTETQYKALMDNGITVAKAFNLRLGVALTAEQAKRLTSDIVWFEQESVKLPDGHIEKVLVPKLYLAHLDKTMVSTNGTLISGLQIIADTKGDITNSGRIIGQRLTALKAKNITNQGGEISADNVLLQAASNIQNRGGKFEAENSLALHADEGVELTSTISSDEVKAGNYLQRQHQLDRLALIHVKGEDGRLYVEGKNIDLRGAELRNAGKGDTVIAGVQIQLHDIQTESENSIGSGKNYRYERVQRSLGSEISGGGKVELSAKRIQSTGAKVHAQQQLALNGQESIELKAGQEHLNFEEYHKEQYRGVTSRSTDERFNRIDENTQTGTALSANNLLMRAGHALNTTAAVLSAKQNIQLEAGDIIKLGFGVNQRKEIHWEKHKKSGFGASFTGGVAAVGYQKTSAKFDSSSVDETIVGTSLKTAEGNIHLLSNERLNLFASELSSGKDTLLQGSEVNLYAVDEHHQSRIHQEQKSSGIGLNMVYNPHQVARNQYREKEQQGATQSIVGKGLAQSEAVADTIEMTLKGPQLYLKHQQSEHNQTSSKTLAKTTALDSQGNLKIYATGTNITSQGSQINVGKEAELIAKENIHFDVATNRFNQDAHSESKGVELNGLSQYGAGAAFTHENGNQATYQEQGTLITVGGDSRIQTKQGDIEGKGLSLIAEGKSQLQAKGDIRLTTAQSGETQRQGSKSHALGEIATSDTERFVGYHRERHNQDGNSLSHSGSQVVSLTDSVSIQAGKDYHQTSGQILAQDKVNIHAQNIDIDAAKNESQVKQSQSDLKVGQFSRVKSPIIDLIQTAERAIKNKEASDRVKAATAMSLAAQGYSLADTALKMANGGYSSAYLLRVESGSGVAHSRQSQAMESQQSQGNLINGKHIELTSKQHLNITHADITSNDKSGKRMAESSISLNGENITIQAGKSTYKEQSRGQSVGVEVGGFAQVGAQTGVGVYAKVGGGSSKANGNRTTYQTSHLDSETVSLNSRGDSSLIGTQVKGNRLNLNAGGDLQITSVQDESHYQSKSSSAGIQVEFGLGNAWSVSGYGNADKGSSNYKQVSEQSGLFAEEGGYHVNANNVHLKGAAIASTHTDPTTNRSELTTNKLTFEDIQNESESKASSASISGGYSRSADKYLDKNMGTETTKNNPNAKKVEGKGSPSFSTGLPMYEKHDDQSITKATLTEGKITLNKDSQPQQTTAAALGINTELNQANSHVEQAKDINHLLAEQKELSEAVSHISSAVNTYTANQAEATAKKVQALEKAKAEAEQQQDSQKTQAILTALNQAKAEQESWQIGGEKKRTVDTVTAILTTALAGKPTVEIATAALSPTINQQIKAMTTDENGKVDIISNTIAHAVWGAIEAASANGNATSGAIAAASAELVAPALMQALYHKTDSKDLTSEEKQTLLTLSSMTSAIASTVTGSHGSNGVENLTNASQGGEIGKRAVENNALSLKDTYAYQRDLKKSIQNGESVENVHKYFKALSEKQREELLANCDIECRLTVPKELAGAIGLADDLSGILSSWLRGLPLDEETKFYQLVESENAKTIQALKDRQSGLEKGIELAMDASHLLSKEDIANSKTEHNFAKKVKSTDKSRTISEPVFSKDSDAYKVAKELGYTKTNYRTKSGAAVFKKRQ